MCGRGGGLGFSPWSLLPPICSERHCFWPRVFLPCQVPLKLCSSHDCHPDFPQKTATSCSQRSSSGYHHLLHICPRLFILLFMEWGGEARAEKPVSAPTFAGTQPLCIISAQSLTSRGSAATKMQREEEVFAGVCKLERSFWAQAHSPSRAERESVVKIDQLKLDNRCEYRMYDYTSAGNASCVFLFLRAQAAVFGTK